MVGYAVPVKSREIIQPASAAAHIVGEGSMHTHIQLTLARPHGCMYAALFHASHARIGQHIFESMLQVQGIVFEGINTKHERTTCVKVIQPDERIGRVAIDAMTSLAAKIDEDTRPIVGPQFPKMQKEKLLGGRVPAAKDAANRTIGSRHTRVSNIIKTAGGLAGTWALITLFAMKITRVGLIHNNSAGEGGDLLDPLVGSIAIFSGFSVGRCTEDGD
eukprot:CAMPEP_0119340376 /NCGR_PEP_ID=MMETSP1333-20130426/100245_1 /TAXON_ID=418940 /ORGANISM="Scyphosphaera apsteinii, Strain RCC1455" /LENGTH=217 /DNA_ID=CAMNT_0007352115 /DNA_START=1228 /DNA_END=1882 /DNA_ORIENTATION=-